MSKSEVFVHVVWVTKYRDPCLTKEIRTELIKFLHDYSEDHGVGLICANGYVDHMHCLIRLRRNLSIAEAVRLTKGASSFWLNRSGLIKKHFEWQPEYYVKSISPEVVPTVKWYIINQEKHHAKQSFDEEIKSFGSDSAEPGPDSA